MGRQSTAVGSRADTAEFRAVLLGRLGLGADAGEKDIETAHNSLVEYLEQAPHAERSWAASRISDVDEAFALLSGQDIDLRSAAPLVADVQDTRAETFPTPVAPVAFAAPPAPAPRTPTPACAWPTPAATATPAASRLTATRPVTTE